MSPTAIFLGRLLGLYLVAISIGMLANRRRMLATLDEIAHSGPWMLFSGMVATAAGLAVVLAHNVWSGGALPVVVTLLIPSERMAEAYKGIGFEQFFFAWMVVVLAIGLWVMAMAFAA